MSRMAGKSTFQREVGEGKNEVQAGVNTKNLIRKQYFVVMRVTFSVARWLFSWFGQRLEDILGFVVEQPNFG